MALTKATYGMISADTSTIDLNIDANTLYVDSSANFVGIGTNAPATRLHVQAGTDTADAVRISGGHNSRYLAIRTFTTGGYAGAGVIFNASSSAGAFKFQTTSTDRMALDSSGRLYLGYATVATPNTAGDDFVIRGTGTGVGMTIAQDNANGTGSIFFGDPDSSSAGSIRYNHNTGDMALNIEDNLHITADKVGIGTTSPSSILHISDASAPEIILEDSDATSTFNITTFQNAAGNLNYNTRQNDGTFVSTDYQIIKNASGANIHKWFIGNAEKVRLDASGRLGIGTTSPSTALHVSAGDGTAELTLARTGTYASVWGFKPYNADFYIRENGTDRVTIKSGGRVGIGITLPDAPLHVEDSTSSAYGGLRVVGAGTGSGSTNVRQIADFGRTNSGSVSGVWLGGRTDETTAVIGAKTASGNIAFEVYSGSWVERMRIKNDGKVGIGTTAPAEKLHVDGIIASQNSGQGTGLLQIQGYGNSGYINTTGSNNLYFRMGSSFNTRMTLTGGGNLLIGTTTTPSSSDVKQVISSGTGAFTQYSFNGGAGSVIGSPAASTLALYTTTGNIGSETYTERMRIDSSGNVAIGTGGAGTTFSGYKTLHFKNTAGDAIQLTETDGGVINQILCTDSSSGKVLIGARSNHPTIFCQNDTERMRINSSGNVGIGTTSPTAPLSIRKVHASGYGNGIDMLDFKAYYPPNYDTETSKASIFVGTSDKHTLNTHGGYLAFKVNQSGFSGSSATNLIEVMRIEKDGNVGIGTTSPDEKLHVVGQGSFENAGNTNRGNLILGAHGSGTAKWSTLGGTHYNDATGSGNGTGAAGCMIIGNYSDASNNRIYIGGGPYELNPATEIRFNTHSSNLHNLGGSLRMVITSAGNVGIGITDPDQALEIGAGGKLKLSRADNSRSMLLYTNNADCVIQSDTDPLHLQSANRMTFATNGASERMRIDSSGAVGIKKIPPSGSHTSWSQLFIGEKGSVISENANSGGFYGTWLTDNMYIAQNTGAFKNITTDESSAYRQEGGIHQWYTQASGSADAAITLSEKMRIDSSGDVGIGMTDTEGSKLGVSGSLRLSGGSNDLASISTGTGSIVGSGSITHTIGYAGTYPSGKKWVWTYAATTWKSFHVTLRVSGTAGFSTYEGGGYNNNGGPLDTVEHGNDLGSFEVTRSGQNMIMTYTASTQTIHPFFELTYRQSGGDGSPYMDRLSLVQS